MPLPDAFDATVTDQLLARLARLQADARPRWEALNPTEMVRHCHATYEHAEGRQLPHLSPLGRLLNRWIIRRHIVSARPFREDRPPAAELHPTSATELVEARRSLEATVRQVHGSDPAAFEGRIHPLYGPLSARQWSTLFWKHLDHHLRQFGV
jgi:hypothetical protein